MELQKLLDVIRQIVSIFIDGKIGTMEHGILLEIARRPHHHPNQHTEAEIKLINNMRRRNPNAGLVVFWNKLTQRDNTYV